MAQKNPLASVPFFDLPEFAEPKNPTGIGTNTQVTDAYNEYIRAREDAANKLEERYAKPNYFKIAAGFLKPQLGGFAASLGSASDAMGEQTELERAIAPTVSQMRSRIALSKVGLAQGKRASQIAEQARREGRPMTSAEAAEVAGYTTGPGAESQAGEASASSQQNRLVQLLSEGRSYTEIISRLPKPFVDQNIDTILRMYPNLKPPEGAPMSLLGASAPAAPAGGQAPANIPGVPERITSNMPIAQQLEAVSQNVAASQETRDKLNSDLTKQATFAVPIFEAATNLYKAASNPDLEKAFGVFEKGDPLGALGKAVESGSFPRLFETARSQIIAARLGGDREKRAISDLQAMEGALSALKVQMQNGVINPTDFRSVAEGESIPGIRNTQDAFLRGAARIGSEALSKYETKAAFDKALEDKKFNVQNWGSSPYFTEVQSNAQKRTQNLITNRASQELPLFMQRGLTGSNKPPESTKPTSGSGTPKNRPSERVIGGTYWKQEGKNWVDTGRKAP
jgi:hypothetical protein